MPMTTDECSAAFFFAGFVQTAVETGTTLAFATVLTRQ